MSVSVSVQVVQPRTVAAVRREVEARSVGSAWRPAIDLVWEFLRGRPGLWTGGHNVFVYHDSKRSNAPLSCEFGVEVARAFESVGEVYATETPGGEAAVALYHGPYDRMNEAYDAISEWMRANGRESAGRVWEIYGDPTPDPADTETAIVYLLK